MIFFEKSQPAPASLTVEKQKKSGTWRIQDVIDRVSADFKHKCYICESQKPNTINVEHFIPHQGNRDLMFDWDNLFAVGFNTPQLAAVKLWQRLEFMVVNPTRTKNFLYKKKYPAALLRGFFILCLRSLQWHKTCQV